MNKMIEFLVNYFKLFFSYLKIIFGTFIYVIIFIYSSIRTMTIKKKSSSKVWKKIKK
jgi:hypothetical protein